MYWIDVGLACIYVANMKNSTKRDRIVSSETLSSGSSLALDPEGGFLYWSIIAKQEFDGARIGNIKAIFKSVYLSIIIIVI